jgi:hypothetical protein
MTERITGLDTKGQWRLLPHMLSSFTPSVFDSILNFSDCIPVNLINRITEPRSDQNSINGNRSCRRVMALAWNDTKTTVPLRSIDLGEENSFRPFGQDTLLF